MSLCSLRHRVNEVASITIAAKSFIQVGSTLFCFIFAIDLLVSLQLVQSMSKFTTTLIWAITIFHEFLAKLAFFFMWGIGIDCRSRWTFSREWVAEFFGNLKKWSVDNPLYLTLAHHSSYSKMSYVNKINNRLELSKICR